MNNKVVTKTSTEFGSVRCVEEKGSVVYCASDVAKALGYSNSRKAIIDHCRCVTKRDIPHPQSPSKQLEVSFIPEADVYRLICHSKLPSAMAFEKWVFEDVVPKAVHGNVKQPDTEQLTLETAEYHYYDKTYRGEPVLTSADMSHFTHKERYVINSCIHQTIKDKDYFLLKDDELRAFKAENPSVPKMSAQLFIVTKSGFTKIIKMLGEHIALPGCFEIVPLKPKNPFPEYREKKALTTCDINELFDKYSINMTGGDVIPRKTMIELFGKNIISAVDADKENNSCKFVYFDRIESKSYDFCWDLMGYTRKGVTLAATIHNALTLGRCWASTKSSEGDDKVECL